MDDTRIQVSGPENKFETIIDATLNGVGEGSRPVYETAIRAYLDWTSERKNEDPYSHVVAYRRYLEDRKLSISTINRHLSALRNFFRTMCNMGLINDEVFRRIQNVRNIRSSGTKHGTWLRLEDAQRLLAAPDITTLIGMRDRALLAVMLGTGLRRAEIAKLRIDHFKWEGKFPNQSVTIENLLGKHNRVRSIPVQRWVIKALGEYVAKQTEFKNHLTPHSVYMFFSIDRHGNWREKLTSQAVWNIVTRYAEQCGFAHLAPHDLRRTYAELMRRNGAELEEIQALLGHSSLTTTQRYLAHEFDPVRVSQIIPLEI